MSSRLARGAIVALLLSEVLALTGGAALAAPRPDAADTTATSADAVGSEAHEGSGVLVVEGRHPTGPTDVHFVVRLTWSGDGHPADPATTALTASILGPQGPLPPVVLTPWDADGRYAGTVSFPSPGMWTVRFSAPNPAIQFDSLELVPPAVPPALPFA
ncbi:MAG TPA: hypothetical protein VK611_27345 [Acidimicrobiales bacterium]|nr:hypothetical protein [Acidimicrobiales bacterium]